LRTEEKKGEEGMRPKRDSIARFLDEKEGEVKE